VRAAAAEALRWLLDLQNRDGGIPTFCRGWNKLPFDRSAADISAHTLAAFEARRPAVPPALSARLDRALPRLLRYLERSQGKDGAWLPLWFGNQWAPDDANPVYGTARVLIALGGTALPAGELLRRGVGYLLSVQRDDGGWAGTPTAASTVEETALAVDALATCLLAGVDLDRDRVRTAADRGAGRLVELTEGGTRFPPTPIGFYFAKLWYFERLYPYLFTLQALEKAVRLPDAGAS